jgi:hypothetical protein
MCGQQLLPLRVKAKAKKYRTGKKRLERQFEIINQSESHSLGNRAKRAAN